MECWENVRQNFLCADNFSNVFIKTRLLVYWQVSDELIYHGNFFFKPDELAEFLKKEPAAKKFIRPLLGSEEFINGKLRYCLWLVNATPKELKSMPLVYERVKNVREFRLASKKAGTRKLADKPTLFAEIRQPTTDNYLLVPRVSSERRKYVPIGYVSSEIICTDANQMVPNATLYDFGVITSRVHMIWLKTVCGRLKSDYRYSKDVVYNNFVWKIPTNEQKLAIEASARRILEIRARYRNEELGTGNVVGNSKLVPSSQFLCSYAELYDEVLMPYELRLAHRANDLAVAKLYGWEEILDDEPKLAVELLKLYDQTRYISRKRSEQM